MHNLLSLLIAIPIVAAIAILLGACAKKTALLATTVNLLLTLFLVFHYDQAKAGYQFTSSILLAPDWKISFFLGVDGLSLLMLLLTAIVSLAAIWIAPHPEKLERYPNLYYACLLFIVAGATGAFASTPSMNWRSSPPSC